MVDSILFQAEWCIYIGWWPFRRQIWFCSFHDCENAHCSPSSGHLGRGKHPLISRIPDGTAHRNKCALCFPQLVNEHTQTLFTFLKLPVFFSTRGKWAMVTREIIKSDLLTFRNTSEVTVVLILLVFCSALPFIAFCFRLAHQAWAQVLNFSFLYAPPFAFFSLLFGFLLFFPSAPALGDFHFGSCEHRAR